MLLAVNVGNSIISVGVFDINGEICCRFKLSTDKNKTLDEYSLLIRSIFFERELDVSDINGIIVSSVVPQLTATIIESLRSVTKIQIDPVIIGPGVKTGYSIKIDNPSELGGDIVANTAAVIGRQKKEYGHVLPSVIVDMSTVTTVSAVNKSGEFIGCTIFPGIQMSFDTMHGNTALLPNVMLCSPQRAIGRNSQESVRSGVIFGNAFMLDGFVYKFAKEMRCKTDELNLTITGEYAKDVLDVCNSNFTYDENLTLKGLYYIYLNNKK